jgi:hypothetical protein
MERVSIISGKMPIIVVAPHGYDGDDENTSVIAESIAKNIEAYAVINRGWERSQTVDFMLDKADCNNVNHCREDVVKEEFLDPILRYTKKILSNNPKAYIYYIHGMGNKHRIYANDPTLDVIVGFGAGSPNSFTCNIWEKDALCHFLNNKGIVTYEGRKGGIMSGWSKTNMNQLFRKTYPNHHVQSMQLEIIHELRDSKEKSIFLGKEIGSVMKKILNHQNFQTNMKFNAY